MALQYLLAPTFQFVNTAGKPLSGGAYMEVYVHGTRTKYFCASDFNGTLHPFRIPLDSLGSNIVLANDTGSYDVYAYNRYGTLMMSRYNVKPGAGGGIGGTITSTDGSIDIHPTEDGVDLSVNGLDPSCLKVSADPRTTDGKFHFDTLVQEGDQAYVDNEGAIRLIKGWYHFTANVQLAWNAGARNETHQVTLYTTLSNSVIDFDISHTHTETIELSGDVSIAQDGSELVIGVSGMPTGLEASVIGMDVHAITGKDGHDKYYAGTGITISNENYIAADFDEVQEKLVAGSGVTIDGNVISAPSLVQVNSDWNATSGAAEILNKPDLDVFATKTEVNTGLAGKQNTIPDLAAIRSGATAGASAVQPSDLAAVATTGSYNDLNHRPNLDQYATDQELTTGLATKQDVISDLATIRSGAAAGATAVQPADLTAGLATKQDVLTPGDNITISNNVISATDQRQADWAQSDSSAVDYIRNKPDLSTYATDAELTAGLATKQDTINDLSTIRSGAAAGATALQPSDVATVATTGDYDDLTNKPSIPTATSDLTNDSGFITSADVPVKDVQVDGASVVNAQGTAEIDLSGYATTQALTTGLAAKQDTISDLATIRSGAAEGATAVQPGDLATVATSGSYNDLSDKPSIPAAQVNSDWNASSGVAEILNKPQLSTVATTGDYDDLSNKPSIPAAQVNSDWNATSGVSEILNKPVLATVATTGSYNDLSNTPSIPTATSDLTNDSGFITLSDVPAQVNADWNSSSGASEILNKPTIPSGTQLVPAATSADADKVLKVNAQGTPEWATGGGSQVQSDWTEADNTEPSYIQNKPVPKTLTAGTGISITEGQSTITIANTVTPPTVDQSYDASSTNAQSGTAVADAIGNLGTNLSAAQLLALKQALGVDETVLYESTNGMQLYSGLQLPETLYNFERILFYVDSTKNGTGTPAAVIVPIQVTSYQGGTFSLSFINGHEMSSNFKLCWKWVMTLSGTTLTLTDSKYWGQNGTAWTQGDNLNEATVFKIVGIHRIASN